MHNNFLKIFIVLTSICFSFDVQAQDFKSEVTIESLPSLSINVIGTKSTKNPYLWSGTSAQLLLQTLEKIGQANLSPATRALVNNLLQLDITGADFNDDQNLMGSDRFFIARLKALENQGEWESVLALIDKVPETEMTNEIRQIKINVLLMKGEVKEACRLQEELPESTEAENNIYADKMRISCFLAKEEKDKALLAYDMFQDAYPDTDANFTALADAALRELPVDLPENLVLSPADVYLYSLIKNPKINLDIQTRGIKKTLADLPTTDILLRLQIGEQIGLSLQELQRLYHLPLINPPADNKIVRRVSAFQKINNISDSNQQRQAVWEWLTQVKKDHLFIPLAPLIAETIRLIEPVKENIKFALDAVRAFALTRNLTAAEPWLDLLEEDNLYQEQYLSASLLLQTLGKSPRDFEDRLIHYCSYAKPTDCHRLKTFLPSEFNELALNSPVLFENNDEALKTQLGNSLLQAVLNITEKTKTTESYLFIQKAARPSLGAAVLREGLIF